MIPKIRLTQHIREKCVVMDNNDFMLRHVHVKFMHRKVFCGRGLRNIIIHSPMFRDFVNLPTQDSTTESEHASVPLPDSNSRLQCSEGSKTKLRF
jgi:hypothetical protein